MRLRKDFVQNHLIDIFLIVLILVFGLWNVERLMRVRGVDEFGYWGIAATISGWDWKEVMGTSPYYSFGYSIVLIPLCLAARLGASMTSVYRIAIGMNALFLTGVYITVQYVEKEIFPQFPKMLKSASAFMIAMYIGNMVQMNTTGAEMYLRFMFWCIIAALIRVLKKPGYKNTGLLLILLANIFAIHMRAIGVVAAVVFILAVYIVTHFRELDKKYILYILGIAVVLAMLFLGIKFYVTNAIYFNEYAANAANSLDEVRGISSKDANDLQSNITRTKSLLHPAGIMDVLISTCGKMYYAFSASLLLGAIGFIISLVMVAAYFIKKIRKQPVQQWQLLQWYSFFVLLAFMGEILISAVYKILPIYRHGKLDHSTVETIVFGRYADFVVGGIMLLGIYGIYQFRQYYKKILAGVICFIPLAVIVQRQFDIMAGNIGSSDIAYFRSNQTQWFSVLAGKSVTYFSYYVGIVSIGIFLLILAAGVMKERKINALAIMLTIISIGWGLLEIYYANEFSLSKNYREQTVGTVVNIIEATDKDTPLYWIAENYTQLDAEIEALQWSIAGRSLRIRTVDDLEEIDTDQAIMICYSDHEDINDVLKAQAEFIYDSGSFNVYIEKKNAYYDVLKEKVNEVSY